MTDPKPDPMPDQPPLGDKIRAKLDEYDVEAHLAGIAEQVEHVVRQGVEKVGALTHEHRSDIDGFLARTADAFDRRTDGRHTETVNQVRGRFARGVARLAEQRPSGTGEAGTSGPEEH